MIRKTVLLGQFFLLRITFFDVAKLDSRYQFNDDSALAGRFPLCVPHVEVFLRDGIVIGRDDFDAEQIAEIEVTRSGVNDPSFHAHLLHRGARVTAIVVNGCAEDLNIAAGRRQTVAGQSITIAHTVHFRDAAPEPISYGEPAGVDEGGLTDGDGRLIAGCEASTTVLQIKIPVRPLLNGQGVVFKTLIVIRPDIDDRDAARGCLGEGGSGTDGQEKGEKCRKSLQPREEEEKLIHD